LPKFTYIVKDRQGKTFRNVIDAPHQIAVVERLQRDNFFIVNIKEITTASQVGSGRALKKEKKFSHKGVKLQDMLVFSRQLATMLEAGVTLIRSLEVIQSQVECQQLSVILAKVKKDVEQGSTLNLSISKHPKVFSQFWTSLIEVGEASGTLPTVLNKLANYIEQQAAFRSAILSGIIYPVILLAITFVAIGVFAFVVGPQFESIFKQMNAELPLITRILLSSFNFIKTNILLILGSVFACVFLFQKYIKTYHGRMHWEKLLFRLPTFGEIFKLIIVERFTSQMSILMDAGVPILHALDISERLVDNATCALIINDVKEHVRKGELLVAAMERSNFFPQMSIQMIMVGEETGELSKMLKHVAAFYQYNVETFMKRFATIIEPFMLVFMGGVVGVILVAMFLPMFNIAQLGGG
jgi:type IV pilus assembly protein PilC